MSWKTIRTALVTRMQQVSVSASTLDPALPRFVVHDSMRWSADGVDGDDFSKKFMVDKRLSVLRLTRTARQTLRTDDQRRLIRHQLLAELDLALNDKVGSELLHQDLVDLVATNLETGDKSLGGIAITMSDPDVQTIAAAMLGKTLVHMAEIRWTVEEVI